jgi:hypothetical protein
MGDMKALSGRAWRAVAYHLHHEAQLRAKIAEQEASLASVPGMPMGKGRHADPTASAALGLGAHSPALAHDQKWLGCIEETWETFAGSREEKMRKGFFGQGKPIRAYADAEGIHRGAAERMRDCVITRCAIFAARCGALSVTQSDYGTADKGD